LDDGDLASIARLRKLQYLEVGNNEITDNGVEHLRGLTELRYLDIGSTEVTDSGLAHLVGLRSLRYLSVLDTHVTAVGVERLQSELPNLKIAWNPEFVRVESTNDDPTAVSPD
jgi:Leucine-rich repeat (LRR) protein